MALKLCYTKWWVPTLHDRWLKVQSFSQNVVLLLVCTLWVESRRTAPGAEVRAARGVFTGRAEQYSHHKHCSNSCVRTLILTVWSARPANGRPLQTSTLQTTAIVIIILLYNTDSQITQHNQINSTEWSLKIIQCDALYNFKAWEQMLLVLKCKKIIRKVICHFQYYCNYRAHTRTTEI